MSADLDKLINRVASRRGFIGKLCMRIAAMTAAVVGLRGTAKADDPEGCTKSAQGIDREGGIIPPAGGESLREITVDPLPAAIMSPRVRQDLDDLPGGTTVQLARRGYLAREAC